MSKNRVPQSMFVVSGRNTDIKPNTFKKTILGIIMAQNDWKFDRKSFRSYDRTVSFNYIGPNENRRGFKDYLEQRAEELFGYKPQISYSQTETPGQRRNDKRRHSRS
jgi:hypothetical protein